MSEDQKIIKINIEDEMKSAYIDYSMSVIMARALPDVRDGMKPVHRRILYGMNELGLTSSKAHKKSARIVGEVLGKYHPHGDGAVYDAMVRMAQDWSLRYPLVDGQGNYGSMDGDSPAAMRYTEARLEKITNEVLEDIKKDTVDFELNFDDSLEEPSVLPTRLPNLLINGASGIAVGMATNMLPHNLTEVINGTIALVRDPELSIEGIMEHIKAPDFTTGGIIYGTTGVEEAFRTGRGRVVLRGRAEIDQNNQGKETIVITEIPFQVNKANLVSKIADLANEGKVEGIAYVNDESDRKGLRIVVDVKRDAMASVVLSKIYKYTPLQTSYGVNNIAIVNKRPKVLNLKEMLEEFVKFRLEVITRRTQFDLKKAEERAHILEGLLIALDNIDEIIEIIRSSKTVDEAKDALIARFNLSEIQAKAILDMRLQKLVGLERLKIQEEYDELQLKITDFKDILAREERRREIIIDELSEIKEKYGDERRTEIRHAEGEISIEDLIADDDVVVTISHLGYSKRTKLDEYRQQGRGGRGSKGAKTRDKDFVEHTMIASNHNYLLFFTTQGRCFWLRAFDIPEASKGSTGRVIQNIIQMPKDDKIKAYIIVQDLKDETFLNNNYILFCTKKGQIKKTLMEKFSRPRANGINAITINEGDELIEARLTDGSSEIVIGNKQGRAIRFNEADVREMGRSAAGVRGMRLDNDNDEVVGMVAVDPSDDTTSILTLSAQGYGKRSDLEDYRVQSRGGKGVKTMQVTDKTGLMVALKAVQTDNELLITTKEGIMIRTGLNDIRVMGRATQGVRIIRLDDQDTIADVSVVAIDASDEEE